MSCVEGLNRVPLHEEHVDEVNEDTGGMLGVPRGEDNPLVEDHEDEVAKETEQEEQLGQEDQVQAVRLPEVPVGGGRQQEG